MVLISAVQQVDLGIHICIHFLFHVLFPILYHRMLNRVPCVYSKTSCLSILYIIVCISTSCAHTEPLPWGSPLRLSERWIQMNSTRVHCWVNIVLLSPQVNSQTQLITFQPWTKRRGNETLRILPGTMAVAQLLFPLHEVMFRRLRIEVLIFKVGG